MTGSSAALEDLTSERLLLLLDYDGTLAPIAATPASAVPAAGARAALAALIAGADHRPYVVTGRPGAQVQALLQLPELPVIGLHGLEWPGEPLPQDLAATVAKLAEQLPDFPGRHVENKEVLLAVHYRATPEKLVPEVEAQLRAMPVPDGWNLLYGKRVVEFRPHGVHKGTAVIRLAQTWPLHRPVYIGDDRTDEDGFRAVRQLGGVGVKVGDGTTLAEYRVGSPEDVVRLLLRWSAAAPVKKEP